MSQASQSSPIPWAALKTHTAILGKTGSGKTSAAKSGIVERALDLEERVCVIDPTSAWWGLRSTASGKRKAYPVAIFGGEHGDYPLSVVHAEIIAEAIGTSSTPTVIDTFKMTVGERTEFFTRFANTLLRKNKGPLNLVIDECHLFMPQGKVVDPRSGAMLHAANNLVSLGRSRGLRITLISQRPAKVHKDSLTQVETMIAMRLVAPQDRAAINAWIADQAEDEDAAKDLIADLPGLDVGEAFVWAPALGVLKRVKFDMPKTFDSSRAPDATGADAPVLAPIDLDAFKGKLAKVEEQKKADDPVTLRQEIERLKRDAAKPLSDPQVDKTALAEEYARGRGEGYLLAADQVAKILRQDYKAIDEMITRLDKAAEMIRACADLLKAIGRPIEDWIDASKESGSPPPHVSPATRPARRPRGHSVEACEAPAAGGALMPSRQKVLDAIAWWSRMGIEPIDRKRAAIASGLSPNASTFGVYVSELIRDGYVTNFNGGLGLTNQGAKCASWPLGQPTRDGLRKMARELIKREAAGRVFDAVYERYPDAITRDDLADVMELSKKASTLGVYISESTALGLIESSRGAVRAADWLFP